MELSSITHIMDETFAYKLDEHKYVIKLITKRQDIKGVKIAYLEKYFREKDMPIIMFMKMGILHLLQDRIRRQEKNVPVMIFMLTLQM